MYKLKIFQNINMVHCFHIIVIGIIKLGKLLKLKKIAQNSCCMLKYEKYFNVEQKVIYIL